MQAAAKLFPVPTLPQNMSPWSFSTIWSNFIAYRRHSFRFRSLYFVALKASKVAPLSFSSRRLAFLSRWIFSMSFAASSFRFSRSSSSRSHRHMVTTFSSDLCSGSSSFGSSNSMNLCLGSPHFPQMRMPFSSS